MSFKRILVGVDGGPQTEALMELAAKFAKQEKAKLWAVHVMEVPRVLPLDADIPEEVERSDKLLGKVEQLVQKLGVDIESYGLKAREAGPALVDEAHDLGADLIVVGMNTRQRLGDFLGVGGSTVNTILKRAPCQIWVVAPSREKGAKVEKGASA